MNVYEEYKVYGPYKRKDGRKHVVLVSHNEDGSIKSKTTVSYPKYLVEISLNKYLLEDETVDHIDGNKTNDDLNNLQVLSRSKNASKGSIRVEVEKAICIWCGESFSPSRHQYNGRSEAKAGPFCGKSCTGKYGKHIQEGGNKLQRESVDKRYYSINNDFQKEYVSNFLLIENPSANL